MDDSLSMMVGPASIASFGTQNPQVAAFLNATFALDAMGISLGQNVTGASAQSVGNAGRSTDLGRG